MEDCGNKRSDETTGVEGKLGLKVFSNGTVDFGERVEVEDKKGSCEELINLVVVEKAGSCFVLSSSLGFCGVCSILVSPMFSSHAVGFFAWQLTSWMRTPSCLKVL